MMDRVVGIDLGTTNSLVAVLDGDAPRVLPDPETGAPLLPSAVSFLPGGEVRRRRGARARSRPSARSTRSCRSSASWGSASST